jgi:hypothetical protein
MLSQFASLLPGILALLVAVAISAVFAWILAALMRRFLSGIGFDDRLAGWGFYALKEWSPSGSPTLLITRIATWLVIMAGFLIGMTAVDSAWTSQLAISLVGYLPNLLGALLVLLVGNVVARFLARSILIGAVNLNLQFPRLLSGAVKWLVIVLSIAMALEHLRIGAGVVEIAFGIMFGGIVLALSLAIGLGSKETVSRSLERSLSAPSAGQVEKPVHHL